MANGKVEYESPALNSMTVNEAWNDYKKAHQQYLADHAQLERFMSARLKSEKAGLRVIATLLNATYVVRRLGHLSFAFHNEEKS